MPNYLPVSAALAALVVSPVVVAQSDLPSAQAGLQSTLNPVVVTAALARKRSF